MSYEPPRTTVLPNVDTSYPTTDELPAVRVGSSGPFGSPPGGSRLFLGILAALLVAALIAAGVIIYLSQRDDNTATAPTPATPTTQAEAPPTVTEATPEITDGDAGWRQVVGVPDGLNVRSGPGVDNDIVGVLIAGQRHVFATGERAGVNGTEWQQVIYGPDDETGWVSGRFLADDVAPDENAPTPQPTVAPAGTTSTVCFQSTTGVDRIARVVFTNRTSLSGIVRTFGADGSFDQNIEGTLADGRAAVTLTADGQTSSRTWTFNPASVDLGNGQTLAVVDCTAIAIDLP